jgi:hypothetical protein
MAALMSSEIKLHCVLKVALTRELIIEKRVHTEN